MPMRVTIRNSLARIRVLAFRRDVARGLLRLRHCNATGFGDAVHESIAPLIAAGVIKQVPGDPRLYMSTGPEITNLLMRASIDAECNLVWPDEGKAVASPPYGEVVEMWQRPAAAT